MADAHDTTSTSTSKPCKGCGETKSLEAYPVQPKGKYGRMSRCKDCVSRERFAKLGYKPTARRLSMKTALLWGLETAPESEQTPDGPIMRIPLSCGGTTVISADDWPLVSKHRWRLGPGGYIVAGGGRSPMLSMHRLIMNAPDGILVDHEDRDRTNNRRRNLRFATKSLNCANNGRQASATSGFKGVLPARTPGKWWARITVGNKLKYLGTFPAPEAAARAYNAAAKEAFGEFASLNKLE